MSLAGGTDDSQLSTLEPSLNVQLYEYLVPTHFLSGREREVRLLLCFCTNDPTHVQRMGVGITVHGDRRDAHLLCGPDHPARDLAPIGDQDFRERSTSSGSTSSAISRCISIACRRTASLPVSRRTLGRETKRPRGVSNIRVGPHSGWP